MKRGFTFWQLLGVLALLLLIAAIMFPVFVPRPEPNTRSSCQSNLKQIGLGLRQYTADYDEKYPLVAPGSIDTGWAYQMQPYLKSIQIFQCPTEATTGSNDPADSGYTDYWYNSELAGKSEAQVEHVALTVLAGDGSSRNSTYAFAGGGDIKDNGAGA
jgi:hypothetical protein